MKTHHVVLVTYGEPPSPSFVDQLTYAWRILQGLTRNVAKIPTAAIPFIAVSRARGRSRLWRAHGYRSPLEQITQTQAASVRGALQQTNGGRTWKVHVAYEFRHPLLHAALAAIPGDEPVWIAPMYAADSAFTHELSRRTASAVAGKRNRQALVLAAHGTLIEPERPIATGRESTEQLCAAIRRRLATSFSMVANGWLNHTRGGRWTEPPIEQTLKRVSDAGFSKVVYYPYGFLADNAESQLEGHLAAVGRPELQIRFLPCLNGSAESSTAFATKARAMATRSLRGRPGAMPCRGTRSSIRRISRVCTTCCCVSVSGPSSCATQGGSGEPPRPLPLLDAHGPREDRRADAHRSRVPPLPGMDQEPPHIGTAPAGHAHRVEPRACPHDR